MAERNSKKTPLDGLMKKCPHCKECMDVSIVNKEGRKMFYCILCGIWWVLTVEGLVKKDV